MHGDRPYQWHQLHLHGRSHECQWCRLSFGLVCPRDTVDRAWCPYCRDGDIWQRSGCGHLDSTQFERGIGRHQLHGFGCIR